MKKTLFIIATMLTMSVTQSNAQSFLHVLKGLGSSSKSEQTETEKSSSSSASNLLSGLGNIVTGLLGTDKVSENSLMGTWSYKQPAIVFESENVLANVGGMAAGTMATMVALGTLHIERIRVSCMLACLPKHNT